jgi:hypothetical protein
MEAHMIEVQSPQSTSSTALRGTVVISTLPSRILTSGMVAVTLFGVSMAAMMSTMPTAPQIAYAMATGMVRKAIGQDKHSSHTAQPVEYLISRL